MTQLSGCRWTPPADGLKLGCRGRSVGMAEGFEPSGAEAPPAYQAGTIGHSVMPPRSGHVQDVSSPIVES